MISTQFVAVVPRFPRVSSVRFASNFLGARAAGVRSEQSKKPVVTLPGRTLAKMSEMPVDPQYPGTAVHRLQAARERAKTLSPDRLNGEWNSVRVNLLWAAGLKDLTNVAPGQGYTGHCFNDYIHCDATTMLGDVAHNQNTGEVKGIAVGNLLGPGIQNASDPALGEGGTWCTCMNGCNQEPPHDVAHVQFKSRIAWKLVWSKTANFEKFVIVDDDGNLLNTGKPTGRLPDLRDRMQNYALVQGSKYAKAADSLQ